MRVEYDSDYDGAWQVGLRLRFSRKTVLVGSDISVQRRHSSLVVFSPLTSVNDRSVATADFRAGCVCQASSPPE